MEEIKQLDQQEAEQIFKLPNSWREKGKKEGNTSRDPKRNSRGKK